jgi:large subunit ribosomal protein L22
MNALDLTEIAGAKATHRFARLSATKARVVLDLIRDLDVDDARDVLRFTQRGAADVVGKVLESAVANAAANHFLDPDGLYVAECWADEGPTLKRFRPRARGRATRIRKRTCHITVIVAMLDPEELAARERTRAVRPGAADRAARVAASRRARQQVAAGTEEETIPDEAVADEAIADEEGAAIDEHDADVTTTARDEKAAAAEAADDEAAATDPADKEADEAAATDERVEAEAEAEAEDEAAAGHEPVTEEPEADEAESGTEPVDGDGPVAEGDAEEKS